MKSLRKIIVTLLLVATLFTVVTPSTCLFAEGNAILPSPASTNVTVETNTLDFWSSTYNRGPNYYNMGNYYVYVYPNYSNGTLYYDITADPVSAQRSEVSLSIGKQPSSTNVYEASNVQEYGGPNEITGTKNISFEYGIEYDFVITITMGRSSDINAYGEDHYIGSFIRYSSTGTTTWTYRHTSLT